MALKTVKPIDTTGLERVKNWTCNKSSCT